jgi:predicted RNase H-like HicB family nuclease
MSSATKLLESMCGNPRDWRIEQLHTVARQYGIVVRSVGGSHQVFSHDLVTDTISVLAHRPIKPYLYPPICSICSQGQDRAGGKGKMKTRTIRQVAPIKPPYPFEAYTYIISPLAVEDGGGYLFTIPDLPGCLSDGETEAEAVENGRDAFMATVSALADMGREIPAPAFLPQDISTPALSGKFVARVPKTLHARLVARAKQEGVSLNALVLALLAEGLGRRGENRGRARVAAATGRI